MNIILAIATTAHLGLAGDYNEVHPSAQLRFDSGLIAGAYLNSESAFSAYAGYRAEWGAFFIEGGGVSGYEYSDVIPYLRAGYEFTDNLSLFVAPALESIGDDLTAGAVIGVEYSFRID
jgi:hypothetical protein